MMDMEDSSNSRKPIDIVLRPDRRLLDADFETYKLDSRALPLVSQDITVDLNLWQFPADFLSSQLVQTYGRHNHLFGDPWSAGSLYFFDAGLQLLRAAFLGGRHFDPIQPAVAFPSRSEASPDARVHASLQFASARIACLSDGAGRLMLVETGERDCPAGEEEPWEVLFCGYPLEDALPFVLCHALCVDNCVHCVTSRVLARVEGDSATARTAVDWLTFTLSPDGCSLSRSRRLEARHATTFLQLLQDGRSLLACCESPLQFAYDSAAAIEPEQAEAADAEADATSKPGPLFLWSQTEEEVMLLTPPLGAAFAKSDVIVRFSTNALRVTVAGEAGVELEGPLYAPVDPEACSWSLEARGPQRTRLEVMLTKREPESWPKVFTSEANDLGLEEEQFEESAGPEPPKPGINSLAQTEECDDCSERVDFCFLLDGDLHRATHVANLSSHQWLCSGPLALPGQRSLCVRHDVDGLVWAPSLPTSTGPQEGVCGPLRHEATFNALGYLWAAKAGERQFSGHAPDVSYAAYCGLRRHVHVYRQPEALAKEMELRNRKTGRSVPAVARHHVISLPTNENIVGMWCSREAVFLLTPGALFAVVVA